MLQGSAGSGKTTICKELTKELGLQVKYTASTGSAAAQLRSGTVNSLLNLGRSKDFCEISEDYVSPQIQRAIRSKFEDIDVLVIDEVSMITPVTLARTDARLRQCLNPNKPFGGLHVILVGDMWQFEPVSKGLKKPALYQGMVLMARNRRLPPGDAYRTGVNIFSEFRLFLLGGQERAESKFKDFLETLRQLDKKRPIDESWVRKLPQLTKKDITNDTDWRFATIATTGNVERIKIIEYQVIRFGKSKNEPILHWTCPVKKGKDGQRNIYEQVDFSLFENTEKYAELIRYFVRGAKCVLGENLCTKLGIAKGTTGVMNGIVWDDNQMDITDISDLPRGVVTEVPQPKYILVNVHDKKSKIDRIIPIGRKNEQLRLRKMK